MIEGIIKGIAWERQGLTGRKRVRDGTNYVPAKNVRVDGLGQKKVLHVRWEYVSLIHF